MASSPKGGFQPLPVPDLPPPGSTSSSYRPSLFAPPADDEHQKTFRALKPVCVELLSASLLTPRTLPRTLKNLQATTDILTAVVSPDEVFTTSLLSYVFFPVSQILQRNPPATLPPELRLAILRVLGALVKHWPGADAVRVRDQVWRLAVGWWRSEASLGGSEEASRVWVATVEACAALPDADLDLDEDAHRLSEGMLRLLEQESFLPILGETFSVLIALAVKGPLTAQPLSLLSALLKTYFSSPMPLAPRQKRILATILPGATSSLTRLVSPSTSDRGGKGARSDVVVLALGIIQCLVVSLFRDTEAQAGSAGAGISDLNDLQDWVVDSEDVLHHAAPPSPSPSTRSLSSVSSAATTVDTVLTTPSVSAPAPQAQLVVLTPSWSTFTLHQLHPALISLTHLRRHQHPLARRALVDLSGALLRECARAFEESWAVLTGNLLVLAGDDFPAVSVRAGEALSDCLSDLAIRVLLLTPIRQHLLDALFTLPFLLRSPAQTANERILAACQLVTATATISELASLVEGILGPLGGVEKWAEGLLDCLRFTSLGATEAGGPGGADRRAELAWTEQPSSATQGSSTLQPRMLRLSNVLNARAERAFIDMLVALGAAGGEDALYAVEHFISLASSAKARRSMRSIAGIWCAELVLEGIQRAVSAAAFSCKGKEKASASSRSAIAPGKRTRKVVRSIVRTLVEREEETEVEDLEDVTAGRCGMEDMEVGAQRLVDAQLPTEYVKGLNPLSTLLDGAGGRPTRSAHPSSPSPEVIDSLRTIQTLSMLVASASILSTSFRPLLLHTLYYLLSHLSSPSPAVSAAALDAITRIAYHTGYASAQNLVLENTDYVINVVSQRLTSQRLDQAAPAVLISMIHLVGGEIVPLVHDIVDEIFDALDAYHGYEVLASTLLAVLDALLKVMVDEAGSASTPRARQAYTVQSDLPMPSRDLLKFKDWYLHRHNRAREELEEIRSRPSAPAEPAPQQPWGKDPDAEEPEAPQEADTSLTDADGPAAPKPTRSQEICAQILSKALFFLTHASPFLRSRVLSLFRSAIYILAPAGLEAQLLPIVNRAWPYILNRVSDSEPYVVLEAMRVLEVLAGESGDFVAGRVRDEGWPLIQRLLQSAMDNNRKASLVLRDKRRSAGLNPLHGSATTPFSTAHRLYAAILATLRSVVSSVPVTGTIRWEILLLTRPFLDQAAPEPLRRQARQLMVALGKIDPDTVWAGLTATAMEDDVMAGTEQERMGWLREAGWDVAEEVSIILNDLAAE